jgi:hypothetical protein
MQILSQVRSVLALHALINNKVSLREAEAKVSGRHDTSARRVLFLLAFFCFCWPFFVFAGLFLFLLAFFCFVMLARRRRRSSGKKRRRRRQMLQAAARRRRRMRRRARNKMQQCRHRVESERFSKMSHFSLIKIRFSPTKCDVQCCSIFRRRSVSSCSCSLRCASTHHGSLSHRNHFPPWRISPKIVNVFVNASHGFASCHWRQLARN